MLGDPNECRQQAVQCRALAADAQGPILRREALGHEIEQAKMLLMAVNMVGKSASESSSPKAAVTA